MERMGYFKGGLGLLLVVPLVACSIDVRDRDENSKDVDVRTPVGSVSVRTNETPETGLPVYPGASPLRDGDSQGADVNIGVMGVGVKVAAGKFESDDAPQAVLGFYRDALKPLGPVTECRGDLDFERGKPLCKPEPAEADVQLLVGKEDDQRIVAVKPRGHGSEIALVHVRTSAH